MKVYNKITTFYDGLYLLLSSIKQPAARRNVDSPNHRLFIIRFVLRLAYLRRLPVFMAFIFIVLLSLLII